MNELTEAQVLEARARLLAAVPAAAEQHGTEYVRFRRGENLYLVELPLVAGVFRPDAVSRLPGGAEPTAGLTVWRGELLLIAEVGAPVSGNVPVVIVLGAGVVGVAADSVDGVETTDDRAMRPASGNEGSWIRSVTRQAVSVVDAEALLRTFSGREQ